MSAITLQLSDDLARLITKYEDRLPEILEQGIRTLEDGPPAFDPTKYEATAELFEFLVGLPAPEDIMKLQASDRLQQRVHVLLEKNRNEGLSPQEKEEMDHYETVEYFIGIAKVRAAVKLGLGSSQHA